MKDGKKTEEPKELFLGNVAKSFMPLSLVQRSLIEPVGLACVSCLETEDAI